MGRIYSALGTSVSDNQSVYKAGADHQEKSGRYKKHTRYGCLKRCNRRGHLHTTSPPEGETVIRNKLKNLEEYIHEKDTIDPLIKLAVIHYQFESIHPFSDGNGRTGRILNILFLVFNDLLELPVLYLSKYIITRKNDYYRLMRLVTEQAGWEPWILYMLDTVEQTAFYTRDKILAIRDLLNEILHFAKQKLPDRMYSKELIELLFHQPYSKGQFLLNAGIAKRKTAAEYLKELEKIGILKLYKIGKENLYLNVKLYELLSR